MPVIIAEVGDVCQLVIARAPGVEEDEIAIVEARNSYQAILHLAENLTPEQISKLMLDLRNTQRLARERRDRQRERVEEDGK